MKRLKHIISWTIWSLVGVYMLLIVLIHLPAVQTFLGEKVASVVGRKLGTKVKVGRVDLGFFNRITLDDISIYDQQQQKMLTANRLSVKIALLPLLNGQVSISSAQLFGAQANFYKFDAHSAANYQFALDALASNNDDQPSQLDVKVNSLIIRHSSLAYNQLDQPETEDLLNLKHLSFNDISANIALKTLTTDSVNLNVKRLAFNEQSGLAVHRFSARFTANRQQAWLDDLQLQLPGTNFTIDSIRASYDASQLAATLQYTGSLTQSSIRPADLKVLCPPLHAFVQPVTIDAQFSGTAQQLNVSTLNMQSADQALHLQANGLLNTAGKVPVWQAKIDYFGLSNSLFSRLTEAIPHLPRIVTRWGNLQLHGQAGQDADGNLSADADVSTDVGMLNVHLTHAHGHQMEGHVSTDGLQLQPLFGNDELGLLAADVHLWGSPATLNAEGHVSQFEFRGYHYRDVAFNGTYHDDCLSGNLKIEDPYIKTDVDGELRLGTPSALRMTGYIRDLTPQALHLSNQWGDASFSAIVDADFTASNLNDAEGSIDLDDFIMSTAGTAGTAYHLDNLHLKSGYDQQLHFVRANGDFGEAELKGQFDWATLPRSFVNYLASKLPTLPGLPATHEATSNNFEANLQLTDTEWMQKLFNVPLHLERPMRLTATVNDQAHQLNVNGHAPAFTFNGSRYQNGHINMVTEGDSMTCQLAVKAITNKGQRVDLTLNTQAADNMLTTALGWDNRDSAPTGQQHMSGTVNAIMQLYANEQAEPEAHVRLLPSNMTLMGAQWLLEPCDILFRNKHLMVDQFTLRHDDQHLIIDGIASTRAADSLVVDMNELDVDYLLDLVNFHSVKFGGMASGKVYVTQAFNDFAAWADLTVNHFTFLEGPMGQLTANAYWNDFDKAIEIHAQVADGPTTHTLVDGAVSLGRKEIDLDIQAMGSPISFTRSLTKSFLHNLDGQAQGELRLSGSLKQMDLLGEMKVNGRASVTPLGTTYDIRDAAMHFVMDDIQFDNFTLYDRQGNNAVINGGIHHRHLKNFTYDLGINAYNLLAFDFPEQPSAAISGTVYASGNVDIMGRPGEVTINCNVTPERHSLFTYNASNPDAISNQQFITWGTKPLVSESLSENQDNTAPQPAAPPRTATDLYVNFLINATPNASLRLVMNADDNITLAGNGVINAAYHNKSPFQMFGTYTVESGTYGITIQRIIKKNFTFQPGGTINFGGNPFDANLNLLAQHTVSGVSLSDLNIGNSFTNNTVRVNCLMNIQGTPLSPRVEFDLEMPTVNSEEQQMIRSVIASEQEMNQQVLYLLGIGRFYTQGANNAGTQQYDQTQLAMQSFLSGTVSTQINEVLSQIIKSNDWNFGANISTGNEGWHNAEYEGIVSGRMLNNRLLINGQFGYRDNATQANPSFIGDFDLRYLLTPSGNLALKVYNQTNDRYFTRSALNTQGVGIIMKKDFNGLGDFFHSRQHSHTTIP